MKHKDERPNHEGETPPTDVDGGWKQIIEDFFEEFLRFFFPVVHAEIDFDEQYEYLDKDLARLAIDQTFGNRSVDKLVRVHWKSNKNAWVLIHVEVQAQPNKDFAERMCRYNVRIWDRYDRDVVSLAILVDSKRDYRPNCYCRELGGCRLEYHFPVVKLLDYRTESELELDCSPMAAVSMIQLRKIKAGTDARRVFESKVDETCRLLLRRGLDEADIAKLFRFLDYLFRLPEDLESQYRNKMHEIEEEMNVPYMSSIERLARKEGLAEGLEKGLIEGLKTSVLQAPTISLPTRQVL